VNKRRKRAHVGGRLGEGSDELKQRVSIPSGTICAGNHRKKKEGGDGGDEIRRRDKVVKEIAAKVLGKRKKRREVPILLEGQDAEALLTEILPDLQELRGRKNNTKGRWGKLLRGMGSGNGRQARREAALNVVSMGKLRKRTGKTAGEKISR